MSAKPRGTFMRVRTEIHQPQRRLRGNHYHGRTETPEATLSRGCASQHGTNARWELQGSGLTWPRLLSRSPEIENFLDSDYRHDQSQSLLIMREVIQNRFVGDEPAHHHHIKAD